ncbi:MAG: hypothetical protein EPO24_04430 [Bacteroidetes bacterium]|nr:MAG: hypothetical protein EPO24_04430 [Bacteroidota bacterium]
MVAFISRVLFIFLVGVSFASAQDPIELSLRKEAEHSIESALKWFEKNQEEDGSWGHYPAITALAVSAFLNSPQGYSENTNASVARAIDFILQCQQPSGGIYIDDLAGYNTAICLMALSETKNQKYSEAIQKARDFLLSLQFNEGTGVTKEEAYFGGIGYKEKERPDLSNLQWAIEALKESEDYRKVGEASGKEQEYSGTKTNVAVNAQLFWDNAILFIQRCQNFKTNDRSWAGDDGGLIYSPSESKAGSYTSYGSMSYAGLKSFIYAGLTKEDERVKAVVEWAQRNFSVTENPFMGEQGLFYYYQTMAKALDAFGDNFIADSSGQKRNWRKEMIEQLIKIQDGEGFWVNKNNRWWENKKELTTSYAVLALEHALQ